MKFSSLKSVHRTALAQLGNVGQTTTDKLAKSMGMTPQEAAHQLCALRKLGLCFSHQKLPGQQYVTWDITVLGQALFDGRPDVEIVVKSAKDKPSNAALIAALADYENQVDTLRGVTKELSERIELERAGTQTERDTAQALREQLAISRAAQTGQRITKYVVAQQFDAAVSGTKQQAILAAQEASARTGRVYHVLGLVAEVTPPEAPAVTLL